MKLFANVRFMFVLAIAASMMVGCADDTPGGGGITENQTELLLLAGPDLVTTSTTVPIGGTFAVNLQATAGDDAMNTIEVFEDGVSIDLERIKYNDDPAASNPVLLLEDSKTAIDVFIDIEAHTEVGTRTYRFTVADDAGDVESVSVDVTTVGTPPALTYNGPSVVVAGPGSLNNINLSAVQGSGLIESIGVEIDGQVADLAGLSFDNVDFTSNPQLIGGDLANGFDMKRLGVRVPNETGTYVYTITLTDEFGLESTTDVTFMVGTPVDSITGVLLNAAGDTGTGGLDLDNGAGTGSSDPAAEIRDQGINTDLDPSINWLSQISGVNGSVIKYLRAGEGGLSEGFTFSSITNKEMLASLVGNGVGFENGVSEPLQVGDMFVVDNGTTVFALLTTAVNPTTTNNDDNYEFTIIK